MKRDPEKNEAWERTLKRMLPLWGHRNWIVIADSAYPAQANPGIETIATEADHLDVLKTTLRAIEKSKHVRARVYLDTELEAVAEQDARGIDRYRRTLAQLTSNHETKVLAHEQIIARLDESAKLFRVLILKSTLTIPYTSVFIELDCGYWTPDAEKRMRLSIKNK
jgi:D-ribose pyranose/furanose isomerase RbsD